MYSSGYAAHYCEQLAKRQGTRHKVLAYCRRYGTGRDTDSSKCDKSSGSMTIGNLKDSNSCPHFKVFQRCTIKLCRSQWPRGLRRRFSAARLLRLWVRIQPGVWMFVCCECCVLSGRGLCDGLITRPEESYRLWRVVVCDLETS